MKQNYMINTILSIVLGIFFLLSLISCKARQPINEDLTCINGEHYFFVGASPKEIGEQIYRNFLWSNVKVGDRDFEGDVYVRFFINHKNDFSDIEILTKTNSPSIDKELMRCVKLIKLPHNYRMNKNVKIEVIALVSF